MIADEIDVLGSAVMGLTLKCARCHSHKFDPIPQRDYYRLLAVFKGAFDEHDWLKPDWLAGLSQERSGTDRELPLRHNRGTAAVGSADNAALTKEIDALKAAPANRKPNSPDELRHGSRRCEAPTA